MVLQKIYVQYRYQYHDYLLPYATITLHRMTGPETCDSAYDGVSTGCGFNLTEGEICDATVEKEGYKTNGDSGIYNFTVPVDPYILLWLYPREPSVTTLDATEITSTSAVLYGELTDLDGCDEIYICFQYGKIGESYTQLEESWYASTDTFYEELTGLTPDTTYNFRIRGGNETGEDTFYVFGDTKQFTTLPITEPPVVYTYDADKITTTGALLRGYLGTSGGIQTGVGFKYGKTTSYGTTLWAFAFTSPGYYAKAITGLDSDTLYHVRAIAENNYGTGYGVDKTFTTLPAPIYGMYIMLPNANGKLFLNNTVIACDDPAKACTEFRFLIMNTDDTTASAWYTVSIVGGGTLYTGTVPDLAPGVGSSNIDDLICALPGGLPVGIHTIKVEVGVEGQAASDSYTEDLYVIEETAWGMYIMLPNANGELFLSNTITACDDEAKACTEFRFLIMNTGSVTANAWYTVSIVDGSTIYTGTIPNLAPGVGSSYIEHLICAEGVGAGGLPIGTHTIKVEVGVEGQAASDSYTEDLYVIEEVIIPIVTTGDTTNITQTTAYVSGYLVDSCDVMTRLDYEYGETTSYGSILWHGSRIAPGSFSRTLEGLTQNTLYHLRTIATNEYGIGYGEDKTFTTLSEEPTYDMYIILPNANGKLFLSNTIIACDDPATACTEFRFLIMNTGNTTASAWYTVSIVGGGTLYTGTVPDLAPGVGSSNIDDLICALPGGLPVGTHTIQVEVGVEGQAATDSYSELLYVLEEPTYDMYIILPNANGKLFLSNTIIACDDPAEACTEFRFLIMNTGDTTAGAWYTVSIVGGATLYTGTVPNLAPGVGSSYIEDWICALPGGLPVGTHTIKVEVGMEGSTTATDSYSEDIFVIGGPAPSGVDAGSVNYLNMCGTEIANNCVTVDIFVEHFGSDNECSVYLECWSEGDTVHNFTDPIVVPYDPIYDEEGGLEVQGVTACIPNCEEPFHIRAVASNSIGTSYSEIVTPITVRLDAPTEVTQTSVTLNAYIVSMGTITTGIALFKYGTPTPDTYDHPLIDISSVGAISRTITGLVPNTTYQYSVLARNKYGYPQTNTGTLSFTTLGEEPPQVTTIGAYYINDTTVELEGALTSLAGASSCYLYFRYGYDESCEWSSKEYGVYDTADGPTYYLLPIGALTPGATLYYRAAAECDSLSEVVGELKQIILGDITYDITFVATAPGISDLHNVDVNDVTDPGNPLYLGKT